MDRMSEVWFHTDDVRCTHPSWPTLRGWGAVSASFFNLFQAQQGMQFLLSETEVHFETNMALVFTTENLLGSVSGSAISSLNIFRYDSDDFRWKMVVHHASPVSSLFPR